MADRIRLSRAKGWRMPENTVKVDRSTVFGNPFSVADAVEVGWHPKEAPAAVVECFAYWLSGDRSNWMGPESDATAAKLLARLPELRGKNLACWCPLDGPCHADVLLKVANA